MRHGLALVFALLTAFASLSVNAGINFRYQLDNRYQTSAGVYDATGHLVRTLWSNQTREAGLNRGVWDGRDDAGVLLATGPQYEVRVLAHNMVYEWEGVMGTTAHNQTSATQLDYPYFMGDFEIAGDRVYTLSASEQLVPRLRYHRLADMNGDWAPRPGLSNFRGGFNYFTHIAADDTQVYVARAAHTLSTAASSEHAAFVVGLDRDLSREISFGEFGQSLCTQIFESGSAPAFCYDDGRSSSLYSSAIDVVTQVGPGPDAYKNNTTGMAVQRQGDFLFVAHGHLNRLHVLNKRTGKLLQVLTLKGVSELAVCGNTTRAASRTELWALHRDAASGVPLVSRFTVSTTSQTSIVTATPALTIRGIEAPLNLALNQDCSSIVVPNGGTQQQLKAYATTNGLLQWSLGVQGGYKSVSPTVSPYKFSFTRTADGNNIITEQAFVGFEPNGSFWVSDTGLNRVLRFSAQRLYADQLAWMPIDSYQVKTDLNNPTRVFQYFKEYLVDYSKPPGQGWQLLSDYEHSLPASPSQRYRGFLSRGFTSVATLGNGRTYAIIINLSGIQDVVEIIPGSRLRFTGKTLDYFQYLKANGDVHFVRSVSTGGAAVEFCERRLTGFDATGNPLWAPAVVVNRVLQRASDPLVSLNGTTVHATAELADGTRVLFDPWKATAVHFRLGAVKPGQSQWQWRASPSTGRFDIANPDGRFDNSDVWYAGAAVDALGSSLVYNFHGEGWDDGVAPTGQANQFLHFHASGLFLGQFGVPNQFDIPPGTPGLAGNSLSIQMVERDGRTYLWHNDENAHAGVHRWRLDGLDWIREWSLRTVQGSTEVQLNTTVPATAALRPAPRDLLAVDVGNGGFLAEQGTDVLLHWTDPSSSEQGFEIQRLNQTYTGLRFERIGVVGPNETDYLDAEPNLGTGSIYRVRALYGRKSSDYSNHASLVPARTGVVAYAEGFDGPQWQNPLNLPAGTCAYVSIAPVSCTVGAESATRTNRVFKLQYQVPVNGAAVDAVASWRALPLLAEFNAAMARPAGSTPIQYRISFEARLVRAPTTGAVNLALELDPGAGAHPFAKTGGRIPLPVAGFATGTDARGFKRYSAIMTAIPNGRAEAGVVHYLQAAAASMDVGINVQMTGVPASGLLELWVDNLEVQRLDEVTHPADTQTDDAVLVTVPDAALASHLNTVLAALRPVGSPSTGNRFSRGELRRLAYLDLRSLAITRLEGLQYATGLRLLNISGLAISDLSPVSSLPTLTELLGAIPAGIPSPQTVPALPLAWLLLAALFMVGKPMRLLGCRVTSGVRGQPGQGQG
jgi:hypothetical protein